MLVASVDSQLSKQWWWDSSTPQLSLNTVHVRPICGYYGLTEGTWGSRTTARFLQSRAMPPSLRITAEKVRSIFVKGIREKIVQHLLAFEEEEPEKSRIQGQRHEVMYLCTETASAYPNPVVSLGLVSSFY